MIEGDFNTRTGEERRIWNEEYETEERKSTDKARNKVGKDLLKWLDETSLGIMNGCTEGDREGDYT